MRKVLFSSTAATYGFHAEMPLRENSPQTPETPYGTTKLAAEWLIKDYARAYGLGYTLLRYFNASGADPDGDFGEDRRHEAHLIPLIFQAAVGRRPKVMIYGNDYPTPDGTCVRDYVHTADLAQAHQLAVESLEPGMGRAYNLGSGTGVTVLEVLRACEEAVRPADPARIRRSAARRPGRADRQPGEDHPRAGLVAPPLRHPRDRSDRLGLASPPPRGLSSNRVIRPVQSPPSRLRDDSPSSTAGRHEARLPVLLVSPAQPDGTTARGRSRLRRWGSRSTGSRSGGTTGTWSTRKTGPSGSQHPRGARRRGIGVSDGGAADRGVPAPCLRRAR